MAKRILNVAFWSAILIVCGFLFTLAWFPSKAKAQGLGYEYRSTCDARGVCRSYFGPRTYVRAPQIVTIPEPTSADDIAAKADRLEAFDRACPAIRNVDKYGVTRVTYAKPGCEFGRTD